jgi:IclR family acetate operon transcriptional repressor
MTPKPMRLLVNATKVIDALAQSGPLTPAQIADQVGIPRSSVYRLVDGLNDIDFTETLEDSSVSLTKKWLHLADSTRAGILKTVAENTGQTSFLSVPRGDEAVCIDWAPGRGIGLLVLKPGRSLPLYAGAAGRVILAYGADDRSEYLKSAPFPPYTPKTLVSAEELEKDIATTRQRGYAISDEDVTPGIAAVGVPLYSGGGNFLGSLSIGGLADEMPSRLDQDLDCLRKAAEQLKQTIP